MSSSSDNQNIVVHVKFGVWPWLIGLVVGVGVSALYYEWGGSAVRNALAQSSAVAEKDVAPHSNPSPNGDEPGDIAPLKAEAKAPVPRQEKKRAQPISLKSPKTVANGNTHALSTAELIDLIRTERGPRLDEIKAELHQRAELGDARAAAVFSFLTENEWGGRLPNMNDPTMKRPDKKEYHTWTVERLWREVQSATPKELEWIKQELRSRAEEQGDMNAKNMYEAVCIFHGIDNNADSKEQPRIRRVMPEPVVCLAEMPPDFYDNWSTERLCLIIRATRPGAKDFQPMLVELKKRADKGEAAAREVVKQMTNRD